MTTKSFATELRDLLRSVKDKHGVVQIKSDDLIAYLEEVINSPYEEITPEQMEEYKAELQVWIKQNETVETGKIEMFRSVILAGQNALKTAFLMNGGATVVLIAFLGKLSDQHQDKIADFASALVLFVFGVLAITVSSGITYLTQWFYADLEPWTIKTGHVLNFLSIGLCLASYGLFIWGTFRTYNAFLGFA